MIPVYVISLRDSLKRRKKIENNLNELEIPFEFVEAIDGRKGLPEYWESWIDRERNQRIRKLSDPTFACALSHLMVYQRIIKENMEYALVLEDDAVPQQDLFHYLANEFYKDADLTQLYFNNTRVYRFSNRNLFSHYKSYLIHPKWRVSGATGYIISREAACHFFNNALPVDTSADWPFCIDYLVNNKRCRVVYPYLVKHPKFNEDKSIIRRYGRGDYKIIKKKRWLGIYIPPLNKIIKSISYTPYKIYIKFFMILKKFP